MMAMSTPVDSTSTPEQRLADEAKRRRDIATAIAAQQAEWRELVRSYKERRARKRQQEDQKEAQLWASHGAWYS